MSVTIFANCGDFRVLCKELFDRGVTGSSNLVVKAQLMRIGITKFIAIAPPGYDNYRKFYYSHFITLTL